MNSDDFIAVMAVALLLIIALIAGTRINALSNSMTDWIVDRIFGAPNNSKGGRG